MADLMKLAAELTVPLRKSTPVLAATIMIAAVAVAGAITAAATAAADNQPHDLNSSCSNADLGNSATAIDGTTVRCIADDQGRLSWFPDTGAVATVAGLQAEGYTVTIDRVGDNPLNTCTVTEVHNEMTTTHEVGEGRSDRHTTTVVVSKTIDVSLDCTAPG